MAAGAPWNQPTAGCASCPTPVPMPTIRLITSTLAVSQRGRRTRAPAATMGFSARPMKAASTSGISSARVMVMV